ncbi:transposase [Moorena bouillonii]
MATRKLIGGTVDDLSIHLVLVTKYRTKIINSEIINYLEDFRRYICKKI